MANHARGRLPWSASSEVVELFAQEMMRAAFGDCFEAQEDEGPLAFKSSVELAQDQSTQVWSDSETHVEMRHGPSGLSGVAQHLEFSGLCAAFGACVAMDEGIGHYALARPGRLSLLPSRAFNGGFWGSSGKKKNQSLWMIAPDQMARAQASLDAAFFNPPPVSPVAIYSTGPEREKYLRHRDQDALDWGAKVEWSQAMERAYPDGEGLDAKKAASALLPSAALGLPCPPKALQKAGQAGLERALCVALIWGRAGAAREIHGRLAQKSADLEASEAKAKALCDKALARRKSVGGREVAEDEPQTAAALLESLQLARLAAKPAAEKKSAPGL